MRRVLVLNCGGTIGMQDTAHGYACGPPGFLSGICRSVPMIHDPAFDLAPWTDKKLGMGMRNGEMAHWDSKGRPVLVWESDEDEYHQWKIN